MYAGSVTQYVPLHSLPDLRPGDLLLFAHVTLEEPDSVSPLIVLDHPDGGLGGWWLTTPTDRKARIRGDRPWRLTAGTLHGDYGVRELARLRGVTLADLADDRWPEVDARLRAARSTAPTISVTMDGENPPRAALKVGDTVPLDRMPELPVGAVLVRCGGEDYVRVLTPTGWRAEVVSPTYGPGDRSFLVTGSKQAPHEPTRLVGLGCTATTRLEWTRQLAACGHEPARAWLRRHDAPPQPAALKIGDVVLGADVPEWGCVHCDDDGPGSIWRRINDRWQTIGFNSSSPHEALRATTALHHRVDGGRVVALGCDATDRVGLARQLAAQGWQPAAEWLAKHALDIVKPPPPPHKVGDEVTAEQAAALPVGAVVSGYREGVVRVHADAGWRNVCIDDHVMSPLADPVDPTARTRPEAGKLLGLGVPFGPTRADVARALATQGYEPAVEALRATGLDGTPKPAPSMRPTVKVGDEVSKWTALPRVSPNWHKSGENDGDGALPVRVVALGPADCTPAQARALYEAASKPAPAAADTFEAATAPYFEPLPELGAVLTADQIRALPVGAVVAEDVRWGYQRLEGDHWRVVMVGTHNAHDITKRPLDPGRPRSAEWINNIRGTLAALDAPRDRDPVPFLRHLADQGWQPARESLERHAAVLAPPAAPAPAVAPWTPVVGEVVPGEHVAALPEGAVIQWNTGDVWRRGRGGFAIVCDGGTRLGGEVDLSGSTGKLIGLGSTDAASAWAMRDRAHKPAAEPALPAPGERVDAAALDRLPVGVVVDSRDGSGSPWAIKRSSKRWDWIDNHALGDDRSPAPFPAGRVFLRSTVIIDFDAPKEPGALRAWCLERGYGRATTVESYVTEQNVRKQALDAAPAAEHDEDMATQPMHITTTAGVFIQDVGEDAQQFAARVNRETRALAAQQPKDVSPVTTQPGALAAFGGLLKSFGNKAAVKALETAVEGRTLVLVDGGRLAVHGAIVKGVEEIWGEGAGSTVKAIAESKVTVVAEDLLGAFGAFVAGKHGLADVLLSRSARRIGDGVGAALVSKGARIVEQVVEAGGRALTAAATAAELPETASTEGEVAAE